MEGQNGLLFEKRIRDNISVREQIVEANRKFTIIWSIAQLLFWGFCLFMSTRRADYLECRHIYVYAVATVAAALLIALFISPRVTWMTQITTIMVDEVFLLAGMAVALHLAPKTILIFASLLCIPVFFICDMLPVFVMLVINIIIFVIAGKPALDPDTYSWILLNLFIFSALGLTIGYFVNRDRFERFIFADSAVKLADLQTRYAYYDQMTGLQNRRAHSEMIEKFMDKLPEYCCVVMADINGLKETNDNLGHEAGDELISASAECLRRGFEGTDNIYRIGGDEFCVILTDPSMDVDECLQRMAECCVSWKGEYVNGISISYGYADNSEFGDIDSIQKAADQRMYQFKTQYYISTGKERRKR